MKFEDLWLRRISTCGAKLLWRKDCVCHGEERRECSFRARKLSNRRELVFSFDTLHHHFEHNLFKSFRRGDFTKVYMLILLI